jgi:hypothetical protein
VKRRVRVPPLADRSGKLDVADRGTALFNGDSGLPVEASLFLFLITEEPQGKGYVGRHTGALPGLEQMYQAQLVTRNSKLFELPDEAGTVESVYGPVAADQTEPSPYPRNR